MPMAVTAAHSFARAIDRSRHRMARLISTVLLLTPSIAVAQAGIGNRPLATQTEVSFRNDVMAVLSKAGCNAGTCHGNKNGKGGFKLSLRGQDPDLDYLSLTRDVFSRRVNPVARNESRILQQPTTRVAQDC